jgi:hypothetical protein
MLPCGLQKLIMSGTLLEESSIIVDSEVAVVSPLPNLEDFRFFFGAPLITANLLTKIGSSCQRLMVFNLLLLYDAAAIQQG